MHSLSKFCHQGLCELVENGQIDIATNLELLLNIFGGIAAAVLEEEDIATQETCSRLAMILSTFQEKGNPSLLQQAFGKMSPQVQNGLNMLLA